jgi:hypothetical protein
MPQPLAPRFLAERGSARLNVSVELCHGHWKPLAPKLKYAGCACTPLPTIKDSCVAKYFYHMRVLVLLLMVAFATAMDINETLDGNDPDPLHLFETDGNGSDRPISRHGSRNDTGMEGMDDNTQVLYPTGVDAPPLPTDHTAADFVAPAVDAPTVDAPTVVAPALVAPAVAAAQAIPEPLAAAQAIPEPLAAAQAIPEPLAAAQAIPEPLAAPVIHTFFQAVDGPLSTRIPNATENQDFLNDPQNIETTRTPYNVATLMATLAGQLKVIVKTKDMFIAGAMGFLSDTLFHLSPFQVSQVRVLGPNATIPVTANSTRDATISEIWFQILSQMMRAQLLGAPYTPVKTSVVLSAQIFFLSPKTTKREFSTAKGITVVIDIRKAYRKNDDIFAKTVNNSDVNLGCIACLNPSMLVADSAGGNYPDDVHATRATAFFDLFGHAFDNTAQAEYEGMRAHIRGVATEIANYEIAVTSHLQKDGKFYQLMLDAANLAVQSFRDNMMAKLSAPSPHNAAAIDDFTSFTDKAEYERLFAAYRLKEEEKKSAVRKSLIDNPDKFSKFESDFKVEGHVYAPVHQPVFNATQLVTHSDAHDNLDQPMMAYARASSNVTNTAMLMVVGIINGLAVDAQAPIHTPLEELMDELHRPDVDQITLIETFIDRFLQPVTDSLGPVRDSIRNARGLLGDLRATALAELRTGNNTGEGGAIVAELKKELAGWEGKMKAQKEACKKMKEAEIRSLNEHHAAAMKDRDASHEVAITALNGTRIKNADAQDVIYKDAIAKLERKNKEWIDNIKAERDAKYTVNQTEIDDLTGELNNATRHLATVTQNLADADAEIVDYKAEIAELKRAGGTSGQAAAAPLKKRKLVVPDPEETVPDSQEEDDDWTEEVTVAKKSGGAKGGGAKGGGGPKGGGGGDAKGPKGGGGGPKKAK